MMQKINPILISGDNNNLNIKKLDNIPLEKSEGGFQETLLQELIHKAPYILPIKEYYPSATSVFSLGREIPVQLGGGRIGYIDNLLITNTGHLVLVETKLARNPEAIREVVAQIQEYGMALNKLSLLGLEAALKSSEKKFRAIDGNDTIYGALINEGMQNINVDFENTLERFLRTGEMLYLIVADGIHVGVERLTNWLNEKSIGVPYKFGLVELKFFNMADGQRIVVPQPLIKTTEISRHVVVVDVRMPEALTSITAEYENKSGVTLKESRIGKPPSASITQEQLLQKVSEVDLPIVQGLIKLLHEHDFKTSATINFLRFGFIVNDNDEFYTLIELGQKGVWLPIYKQIRNVIGIDKTIVYRKKINDFAKFYRDDQINKPDSSGCEIKYHELKAKIESIVAYLNEFKEEVKLDL